MAGCAGAPAASPTASPSQSATATEPAAGQDITFWLIGGDTPKDARDYLAYHALVWGDPGGVGTVLRRAPGHPGPMLLLWFFLGLTLGGVQSAVAVMLLGYPDPPDPPDRGLGATETPVLARTRR